MGRCGFIITIIISLLATRLISFVGRSITELLSVMYFILSFS
jgi:hypothetical protein